MTQQIKITGFHCEACTKITTKRILKISGVSGVVCDLATGIATITLSREISKDEINAVLSDTIYKAI